MEMCKGYKDEKKAKILVIGYNPMIQSSNNINEYYFNISLMRKDNEVKKVEIAELVYKYISDLTNNKYNDDEIYLLNLCSDELQYIPKKKRECINTEKSYLGIERINKILEKNDIEYIFAMSLEVNYWLQSLGFYSISDEFLYQEYKGNTYQNNSDEVKFKEICGGIYAVKNSKTKIIPVLQAKQYLINKSIKKYYEENYNKIKTQF